MGHQIIDLIRGSDGEPSGDPGRAGPMMSSHPLAHHQQMIKETEPVLKKISFGPITVGPIDC